MAVKTTIEEKDQIVSWNGDPAYWQEYVKRVQFQYERKEPKKRALLGAELASRLTGRAWEVTSAEIDHSQLQRSDGAAYLLRFLEDKRCKAPIADTGQRLEDMLIRLRRTPGTSMAERATTVQETYRRLQRAMARQRRDSALRKGELLPRDTAQRDHVLMTPESRRRGSDVTSPAHHGGSAPTGSENCQADEVEPGENEPGTPTRPNEDDYEPLLLRMAPTLGMADVGLLMNGMSGIKLNDGAVGNIGEKLIRLGSDDALPVQWEQFDYGSEQILPEEILGWLLLRRSGLPTNARLSILIINNCLDFATMERAKRDQEEEFLLSESHRHPGLKRPNRSFRVEEDGAWGLLAEEEMEDINEGSIHWVGSQLPEEVYPVNMAQPSEDEYVWVTQLPDGQEMRWHWYDDDFYAQDLEGCISGVGQTRRRGWTMKSVCWPPRERQSSWRKCMRTSVTAFAPSKKAEFSIQRSTCLVALIPCRC